MTVCRRKARNHEQNFIKSEFSFWRQFTNISDDSIVTLKKDYKMEKENGFW